MVVWQSTGYRWRQKLQQRKQRADQPWKVSWAAHTKSNQRPGMNPPHTFIFIAIITFLFSLDHKSMRGRALNELSRTWKQFDIPPNRTLLYFFSKGIPTASLNQSTTLCRDWYAASYRKEKNITSHGDIMKTRQRGRFSMSQLANPPPPPAQPIAANLIRHDN